jgi:hypothetical protein
MQNSNVNEVAANNSNRYHVLAEMVADKIKELISKDSYEGEACVDADGFSVEFSYGTEFEHCTGATSTRMFHPDIVEEWDEPTRHYASVDTVFDWSQPVTQVTASAAAREVAGYIDGAINTLIN